MSKEEIAVATHSGAELEGMLRQFGFALPLHGHSRLFGGYSGSNYRVEADDGALAVLKVCHGYAEPDVDAQARVMAHARANGFAGACTALPRPPPAESYVGTAADGCPCCMLSWVDGKAADKVIKAGARAETVLGTVGDGLARLHSVPVDASAAATLRDFMAGGACDVRKQLSGEFGDELTASPRVADHPFLPFYARQLAELRAAMGAPGLPRGLLHGDPFLDNLLVSDAGDALCGFVDFEDGCVGPLLFDVGCCVGACCFGADDTLELGRLRALLAGYARVRALAPAERAAFVGFVKLTLLCNCSWRFKNFHVDRPELLTPSTRCAHEELQRRIEYLEQPDAARAVEAVLAETFGA